MFSKKVLELLILFLCLASPPSPAWAGDWPNWRGPHYDGSSDETNLPERFDQTENVLWRTPIKGDDGAATPIVIGDRIFINTTEKIENGTGLVAMCLERKSGKILWKKQVAATTREVRQQNTWASASPVSDGKRSWFLYGTGDLACLDEGGNILWARNLQKEHGTWNILWDYGASPLLYKGKLYVAVMDTVKPYAFAPKDQPKSKGSYLLCTDSATGKDLWKQPRKSDAVGESLESYATPIPFSNHGREEILLLGADYVTAHNPDTGEEYWRFCYAPEHRGNLRIVPSPVVAEGNIIIPRPKFAPVVAVAVPQNGQGRLPDDKLAWRYQGNTADTPTPLFYQGRLYIIHDNKRIMTCLNPKTGEKIWEGDLGATGIIRSSPTAGDGKIYCISMKGEAVVVKAGDEFKILSMALMGGSKECASIAIADQCLFIRTSEDLFCVGKAK
ncbi:MAG: PQQ-binding-like beta-propeller repeat protein [Candidatus Sumerlaeota bacterium]|nr:PQQ-binding-like beta-propeller repeat protein [Candidatus Sumerlaeota bacterium]